MCLGKAVETFFNHLGESRRVRQWKLKVFNLVAQFRRNRERWAGQDESPPVAGKLLGYITHAAHDDWIIHVTMKVFENDCGVYGHGLQVTENLGGFKCVSD